MASSEVARFRDLLAQIQEGSEEAARELVDSYGDVLYKIVRRRLPGGLRRRVDSQDIMQSAWGAVFADRINLGQYSTPKEFLHYLTLVTSRTVNKQLRRETGQKRDVFRDVSLDELLELGGQGHSTPPSGSPGEPPRKQFASDDPTPSHCAAAKETYQQWTAKLSQRHQQVLKMSLDGYSFKEIADFFSVSERRVRQMYYFILSRQDTLPQDAIPQESNSQESNL